MPSRNILPAAQYRRTSTDLQEHSMENQKRVIQEYATDNGFAVVRTYADSAKSGVGIKRRSGLRQLLQDAISGNAVYAAILVYDVSRWGRFVPEKSESFPPCVESVPNFGPRRRRARGCANMQETARGSRVETLYERVIKTCGYSSALPSR